MTTKAELLDNLRTMLRDVFHLKNEGTQYARMARAHGYIDGYMRVLLETNTVGKQELLKIVAEERERAAGPATIVMQPEGAAA